MCSIFLYAFTEISWYFLQENMCLQVYYFLEMSDVCPTSHFQNFPTYSKHKEMRYVSPVTQSIVDGLRYYEDDIEYVVTICEEPSNSNISYVWFLDNYHETLVGGQVAAAFLLLFLLIGLPLNLTVMTLILKKKLYKRPSLVLMFNLMLSDLIFILLVIPEQNTTAVTGEFCMVHPEK